ncbi:MAG: crossover junction endodeoxyribonuclease RuvC [Burkholderiales bacterium]|nr:crossover junction endodeoxyribonuclease RuvC [Burkholderiales bacterium]
MRILGIDPGLRATGYGVIESDGARMAYVASGTVRADSKDELPLRLKAILEGVAEVVATHGPQLAVVEKVFVNSNPQSTLLLGQARGAAICALVAADLPVFEYTALQIKQAVAGHGKAHKSAVQEMVRRLLRLSGSPSPDAADALATAICHTNHAASRRAAAAPSAGAGLRLKHGRLV